MINFAQLTKYLASSPIQTAGIRSASPFGTFTADAPRRGQLIDSAPSNTDEIQTSSNTQSSAGSAQPWITKH